MLVSGEWGEKVDDVAGRKREAAEFVQTVDFKFQPCSNSTTTRLREHCFMVRELFG